MGFCFLGGFGKKGWFVERLRKPNFFFPIVPNPKKFAKHLATTDINYFWLMMLFLHTHACPDEFVSHTLLVR